MRHVNQFKAIDKLKQKMKFRPLVITVCMVSLNLSAAIASDKSEMNARQTIDNASMNKIVGARLRGMLAGETAKRGIGEAGAPDSGCNTSIGSSDSSSPLDGGVQEIIIIGDIINICH